MNGKITITTNELSAEYARLDALREIPAPPLMTDEQFELVSYGRHGTPPVTWPRLLSYWESRGWGRIPITTLKGRYEREVHRRGNTPLLDT